MYAYSKLSTPTTQANSRRKWICLFLLSLGLLLIVAALNQYDALPSFDGYAGHAQAGDNSVLPPLVHTNVAVASHFGMHFDVHLALVKTITDVLNAEGQVRVWAWTPLAHDFQDVVDLLHLYEGDVGNPDDFMNAINSTTTDGMPESTIDLVVFGTCEIDMRRWSTDLLEVWDARPQDKKFKLVCIVHHVKDTLWQGFITPWATRGAIRLLPIASHVGRAFRNEFRELADSPDEDVYKAMYEYVDIDVHAPVLDLPNFAKKNRSSTLSRAVIQGHLSPDRRDYEHVFRDLQISLKEDAKSWGYLPLSDERDTYEVDPEATEESFTLHLVGNGLLDIPHDLTNIVFIHAGLVYEDFYALMQTMNVVLPAFVNKDYYDYQASSTVAMAVQCDVPILANRRMRRSYGYIDDDRVTITRPQALREIFALHVLRTGRFHQHQLEDAAERPVLPVYAEDIDVMLRGSWQRTHEQFAEFKKELWASNRRAVERILTDSRGDEQFR